ncbi:MAG: DUF58 domain-containing protein [Thermoanaerobaculia bacterium]
MARTVPEGIRLTKVGAWYIAITLVVGVAAANTGNNALYLVEALLLATLVLSGFSSRRNVRGLEVGLELPDEAYAHQPFSVTYRLANRDLLSARRLVVVAVDGGNDALVAFLARRGETTGQLEMLAKRRGLMQVTWAHLHSLFPLGLFRKGVRVRLDHEMLVFPELYPAAREGASQPGQAGDRPSRRKGWGHELLGLRRFQPGDDRRSIHWKRSAKLGELVFMERESEQGRRLSIALDNAVGELAGRSHELRFERLVSEAATAAHDYLGRGYEVELVTRGGRIPFGVGRSQRLRILRELALLQPLARTSEPLLPPLDRAPRLRLAFELGGPA